MSSRRKYLILEALDPGDGQLTARIQISHDRMMTVGKRSMGHALECGIIVPMILKNPTAVFEGLTRDEDEDRRGYGWRCYCGLPEKAFDPDGTPCKPYSGQVYLVFVNEDQIAYNWRWEPADPNNPRLVVGHETRFRKCLFERDRHH